MCTLPSISLGNAGNGRYKLHFNHLLQLYQKFLVLYGQESAAAVKYCSCQYQKVVVLYGEKSAAAVLQSPSDDDLHLLRPWLKLILNPPSGVEVVMVGPDVPQAPGFRGSRGTRV